MRRFALLVLSILVLVVFSLLSLSVMKDGIKYVVREIFFVIIGFVVFYIISRINFRIIKNYALLLYVLSVMLLVFVLIFGIAKHSSKRWIDIFGLFTLQPSEFAKIGIIIALAFVSSFDISNTRKFLFYTVLALPAAALIFAQPDMGSSLVILFIYFMFIAFTLPLKFAVGISFIGIFLIPFLPKILLPYQMERIFAFFDPYMDPLGSGYNVLQSIIAIGSGQVFGKGLSGSIMTKLKYVPVQYADFIFSSVGEIFGFIGCVVVIVALCYIVYFSARAYALTNNKFGKAIMLGIFSMFFFQILINIGMTLGIMPVTGIPLPFISYAGNAMLVSFIAVGLIASVITYQEEMTLMP